MKKLTWFGRERELFGVCVSFHNHFRLHMLPLYATWIQTLERGTCLSMNLQKLRQTNLMQFAFLISREAAVNPWIFVVFWSHRAPLGGLTYYLKMEPHMMVGVLVSIFAIWKILAEVGWSHNAPIQSQDRMKRNSLLIFQVVVGNGFAFWNR